MIVSNPRANESMEPTRCYVPQILYCIEEFNSLSEKQLAVTILTIIISFTWQHLCVKMYHGFHSLVPEIGCDLDDIIPLHKTLFLLFFLP